MATWVVKFPSKGFQNKINGNYYIFANIHSAEFSKTGHHLIRKEVF